MARRHTGGFDVLGFERDPAPGDPDALLGEAVTAYEALGEDAAGAAEALVGSEVEAGSGEAMDALREVIGTEYPGKLRTAAESFRSAAQAYRAYATSLADAQADLDRAMDQALPVAAAAAATVPTAPPDADDAALDAVRERQDEVDAARSVLGGAQRLAQDAAALRERAGQQFASELDGTATVPERGFFEKIGDFLKDNPLVQIIIGVVIGIVAVFFPVVGLALGVVALGFFTAASVASGDFNVAAFVLEIVGLALGGVGVLAKLVPSFGKALGTAASSAGGFFSRATGSITAGISDAAASVARVGRATAPAVDDAARAASRVGTRAGTPPPSPVAAPRTATPDPAPPAPATAALDGDEVFTGFLGGGAQQVNRFLRDPSSVPAAERAVLAARSDAVSAKIASLPALGETTVFRGVLGDLSQGLARGDTFTDPAFVSTTLNRADAERFAVSGGGVNVADDVSEATLFQIRATGGRDVSGLTGLREAEVLFDRGTPFVVDAKLVDEIRLAGRPPVRLNRVFLRSPDVEVE